MGWVWGLVLFASVIASANSEEKARKLYERLTGVPLLSADPRLRLMASLIDQGDWDGAGKTATRDERFINVTVRDWAATLSNLKESVFVPFNDFEALVMGVVRDEMDARQLLTGDFRYEGADFSPAASPKSSEHYLEMEKKAVNFANLLVKRSPQWDEIPESAGLLTTYNWAAEHLIAGTNRRATEFTFQEFLCAPIWQWRDFGRPDSYIRRDVAREPSGSPETFQTECRSCHAQLDGLTGAFASYDFVNGTLRFGQNWVAPKMNQNAHVYPKGHPVRDASWINLATQNHNEMLGWRTPVEGYGLQEFGHMVAHAKAFSGCMVKRAYRKVCRAELVDESFAKSMADQFEEDGYNLQHLFRDVAVECTKTERSDAVALKNFREIFESLQVALRITPLPDGMVSKTFQAIRESLPSAHDVGQYNGSMQWALVKLTSEACRSRIETDSNLPSDKRWLHKKINFKTSPQAQDLSSAVMDYAAVFWQRPTKNNEETAISTFLESIIKESPDEVKSLVSILTALCSMMGSATEAISF